ncbi:MAG: ParB/RepB/Spo0J family partition protein [candidate division Zixibacteria bacterium]|nr:ParB/RepB/Spo0J family partition protein [candidate division Zixibacteria bacterium]
MPKFVSKTFLDHIVPGAAVGQMVALRRVMPNPEQPRKRYRQEDIEELAASIREHGLINPITVDEKYRIIAGERRWQACQLAGLEEIPVIVRQRSYEVSLVENLQRRDLHPIDEAEGFQRLVEDFGYTQMEIARRVGKDQSIISKTLSLLKLPTEIKDDYAAVESVSRDLLLQVLDEPTRERQLALWARIKSERLSARAVKREKKGEAEVSPRVMLRSFQSLHRRVVRFDLSTLKPRDRDRLRAELTQTINELARVLKKIEGKKEKKS